MEQGLELQNGAITLVGTCTSCMQRNNSHETVPLTGEEPGLELQNGAVTLVGSCISNMQRNLMRLFLSQARSRAWSCRMGQSPLLVPAPLSFSATILMKLFL